MEYKNIEDKVDKIMTNHLPHLQAGLTELQVGLNRIDNKLAYWSGGIIVAMAILQFATQFLSK